MDSASAPKKENCKYWEKCYQTNEAHREKYNHPESSSSKEKPESTAQTSTTLEIGVEKTKEKDVHNKKRKSSEDLDDDIPAPKQNDYKRLWAPDGDYTEIVKVDQQILAKFLVKMPKDFYLFWDFANQVAGGHKKHPFRKFNLELVGPFEVMSGKFDKLEPKSPGEYLRHWRFYYDPPEFQTIFVKKDTGIHYGYWRDDAKEEEDILIARNDASKGCEFEFVATNMFDAFAYFLEKDFPLTPFNQNELSKVRKAVNEFVTFNPVERSPLFIAKDERWKIAAAKTFHGAGIVVPVDKNTNIGYRPLIESDANLKKILSLFEKAESEEATETIMEKLQPIISAAVIALDECDFGTNLELGIDFFASGHQQLHGAIQTLLVPAYTLLERPELLAILKAHLDDRKNSLHLSIFN